MPAPHDGMPPGPDEIDRGLREIIAGVGGEAATREPSAAERARRPAQPAPSKRLGWRNARKARKLRKPVPEPGRRPLPFQRGKPGSGAPAGRRKGVPRNRSRRWHRVRSAAKVIVVLVLFAGLLFGLHLLGFGPQ